MEDSLGKGSEWMDGWMIHSREMDFGLLMDSDNQNGKLIK